MSADKQQIGEQTTDLALSILIVGYNSARFLPACLSAIEEAVGDHSYEVLFVNNGTDGSEALIQRDFGGVRLLPSRGNVGFAKANNYCAEHARGQVFLLLNPDTEAHVGSIARMVDAMQLHPEYDILGGQTVTSRDGSSKFAPLGLPGVGSLARGLIGRAGRKASKPDSASERIQQVDCASGGCMMIRRSIWERLGGFDERYFLYAEDIDLCRRATDSGANIAIVPDATIFHDVGSGNYFSSERLLYQMRGNALYFRTHMGPAHAQLCLAMLWLSATVRWIGGGIRGLGMRRYRQMSSGFRPIALKPWRWWRGYPG